MCVLFVGASIGEAVKIKPKKWEEFQHYKDRRPPWIRLHRSLLDNREFNALPPMACKVLILIWLLASESESSHGVIDGDPERISFRVRLPVEDVAPAIAALMDAGFLTEARVDDIHDSTDGKSASTRARENSGFGSRYIPDSVRREVWKRDHGKCCACAAQDEIEYDHIIPVSRNGTSDAGNVQLLCKSCNRRKRTRLAEQVATQAQPGLERRTTESETESESETETTLSGKPDVSPPETGKRTHINGHKAEAVRILDFLNEKTGRNYRRVEANLGFIAARLQEGATETEMRQVIAKKTREWLGDEKMAQYLRPLTLFNKSKFAQYQGELGQQIPKGNKDHHG